MFTCLIVVIGFFIIITKLLKDIRG